MKLARTIGGISADMAFFFQEFWFGVTGEWQANQNRSQWLKALLEDCELIGNGYIPREKKLRILEAKLLCQVREDRSAQDVVEAIAILNEVQKSEDAYNNSIRGYLDQTAYTVFLLGLVIVPLSFAASSWCGGSQSKFCKDARVVPNAIAGYFQEPKAKP